MYIHIAYLFPDISIYTPNVSRVILWWMANKRLSIGAILAHSHPFHFSFSPTHRMEEKDRGGGGPSWTDPTFGPPSGSRRLDEWKRRAVPNSNRESRDRRRDRSDRSAGRKSSRSERRRRYQNPSDSDEDSRPPDGVKREVLAGLGGTSGVTSAGAWSARLEIANLLEVGVSPEHVIDMVRKGKEADFPLGSNGGLKLVWVAYIDAEEEGRLSRLGKMPKAQPELVIKDSKLALNSKAEEDLPPAGIVDGEKVMRKALEIRARSFTMTKVASYEVYRRLHDKYFARINATVPSGMRRMK